MRAQLSPTHHVAVTRATLQPPKRLFFGHEQDDPCLDTPLPEPEPNPLDNPAQCIDTPKPHLLARIAWGGTSLLAALDAMRSLAGVKIDHLSLFHHTFIDRPLPPNNTLGTAAEIAGAAIAFYFAFGKKIRLER